METSIMLGRLRAIIQQLLPVTLLLLSYSRRNWGRGLSHIHCAMVTMPSCASLCIRGLCSLNKLPSSPRNK